MPRPTEDILLDIAYTRNENKTFDNCYNHRFMREGAVAPKQPDCDGGFSTKDWERFE